MENELNINSEPNWVFEQRRVAACESIQTMMPSSVPLKLQWSALKEMCSVLVYPIKSLSAISTVVHRTLIANSHFQLRHKLSFKKMKNVSVFGCDYFKPQLAYHLKATYSKIKNAFLHLQLNYEQCSISEQLNTVDKNYKNSLIFSELS